MIVNKTQYFSEETIDTYSRSMLQELKEVKRQRALSFTPENSALLILDMQKYFLYEKSHAYILSAPFIVPKMIRLAKAYEKEGLPIVLTRHLNTRDDAGMMKRWWKEIIDKKESGSEIISDLNEIDGIRIEKTQYDSFYRTALEKILREKDVTRIVITGVMTHLCCETTARSAFVRDFEVFFPVDGTATYNEDFHRAALLNLTHGFVHPVLMEELINQVEESGRGMH